MLKKETLNKISKRFTMNMGRMNKAGISGREKMLNCSRVEQGGLNPEKKMIKKRKFVEKRWTKKMAANLFSRISTSSLMELAVIAFQNDDKHAPITS